MAKTPQAKASQAASAAAKRRKSGGGGGADAARDKQTKNDQQESKHEEKKKEKEDDDDTAKPSEEEEEKTPDTKSKPVSNTTKKRAAAAAKSDPKSGSSKDDSTAPPSKRPKKERRQGTRQSSRSTKNTTTADGEGKDDTSSSCRKPNKAQLLLYLTSAEAEHLCRPDDESEALSASPPSKITKTYGGGPEPLSPFEELICAMILSRPISHRLGLRTIRTVLNEPYNFSSAKKVQDAGDDKRRQALWDAKTQHKDKTASQLGLAGDVVLEKYCRAANADSKGDKKAKGGAKGGRKSAGSASAADDGDAEGRTLAGLVAQSDSDIDDLLATLQSDIKGFGKTTAAIFRRRMQWAWDFAYPYVDERTADGLKDLGLPIRAEPLAELVEEHWEGSLKGADLAGDDEETRKRRAFTVILERATNARLEGKVGDVLAAAAKY